MKVCLINPPPYAIQELMYDRPIFPRPSLACLGATLRAAGCDVLLIDAKLERLSNKQVLDRVAQFQPQVVGFTAFTNEIKPAAVLARAIKHKTPDVVTLVGGVHVTAIPHETMREFPEFDIGVLGQGDLTAVELCSAIHEDRPVGDVNGIIWRDGDTLRKTEAAQPPALCDLPDPAWDMLPRGTRYHIMTARGCPFRCNFCLNPNGRTVTERSTEQVLGEIEFVLKNFSPDDEINFWVDNEVFYPRKDQAMALCDAMINSGLHKRIRWFAQTHVNLLDRELLIKMKEAGCVRMGLGIESGDDPTFKGMGKGITVDRAWKACREAADVGMPIETYFIIGHPNETVESAKRTVAFAAKINPLIPIFGIMVPYPGTHVARMAQAGEGGYRLITTDWNEYNKQIGGAVEFEHLSRFQLEWLQTTGYLTVFWKNKRYKDLLKFIWTYKLQAFSILKKWARNGFRSIAASSSAKGDAEREPLKTIFSGHVHDDKLILSAKPSDGTIKSLPVLNRRMETQTSA